MSYAKPVTAAPAQNSLEYMRVYSYIFQHPNWMNNLLFVVVLNFIPVIGPILVMGYQYEIIEAFLRRPGQPYPDFDFGRFTEYLVRGCWPFLVALVASLIMVPAFIVVALLPMLAIPAAAGGGGEEAAGALVMVAFGVMFLLIMGLSLLMAFCLLPMQLAAGLTQDFGAAFRLSFIKDFIGRVWVEILLGALFMGFSAVVIVMLGYAALCIGVLPAQAIIMLAQAHFLYQLYLIYLTRGGQPLPLKEPHHEPPGIVLPPSSGSSF